ncbi:MAG: MATE family efflux transporter [Butyrivibrio sp.]
MVENKNLEVFESATVQKAVFKNALPAMAAMLMVLIYNLADTFFIGQTNDDIQIAAVSLATPVFLLFMAVGTIFGIGGTSVISRAIGAGKLDYAKKVCSFCMWSCVGVGIIMSILFLLFMNNILTLVGASKDTWEYAKIYLMIVSVSGPFVLISNCYSNILRAEGQSGRAMTGQLLGNLLNVILDPIMIRGFEWNIAGAAIATVIGNVVGACYYIGYFLSGKSILSINVKIFTFRDKVASGVFSIGIPAALGSLMMSVSQIVMNSKMAVYGDMALAGVGVAMKVTMMTGMVCIGLGQGIQPLLGYCVGAGKWNRYEKILKFSLVFAFVLSTVLTGVCYLFTNQIVHVFLTNESAFAYGVSFSRILLSTSFLFGVFYVITNALQACGAARESLVVNISRQGLIYIPAMFILCVFFRETGLLWAQPVADILSLILAILLYIKTSKRMVRRDYKRISDSQGHGTETGR